MTKKVARDARSGKFVSAEGSFVTEKRGYSAKAPADKSPPSSMMASDKKCSPRSSKRS